MSQQRNIEKLWFLMLLLLIMLITGCDNAKKDTSVSTEDVAVTDASTIEVTNEGSVEDTSETAQTYKVVFETLQNPDGLYGVVRAPEPMDMRSMYTKALVEMPTYDANIDNPWQVDLRSRDLTQLDLIKHYDNLIYATFDSKTLWPNQLPVKYDYEKVMDLGKNPGLGIRELHSRGITGKGVGIAIIDQTLLVNHSEYKDQLKFYEEIHNLGEEASFHGPVVASIAVGKSVGVAPQADLYYIAETHGDFTESSEFVIDVKWVAKSIDRIIEVNRSLSKDEKIRVISISLGINPNMVGYEIVMESISRAEADGIYTVYVEIQEFSGLGRDIFDDPEDVASYEMGLMFPENYYQPTVWVPMDSRCMASPTGIDDYIFNRQGGMSWTVPYVAGLYALVCQVNSEITPDLFWDAAFETSYKVPLLSNDRYGNVINPTKLLEKFLVSK